MKQIFEEYGPVIIAIIVVIGLVSVVAFLFSGDDNYIATLFKGLFDDLTNLWKINKDAGKVVGPGTGGFINMFRM